MSTDLQQTLQQALHHLQSGSPEVCVRICDEILAGEPGLIQALYLRGCAAYQTGDIEQSVNDLEVVHGNHPEHLHAAYFLGRSLRAASRPQEAITPLQAVLRESELEVQARYELAACLALLRRRLEAIDHYLAILELEPNNAQVAANLAALLERENRLDEAESWAGKALQLDPANETAQMILATLERRNGNYPEATRRLRSLIPGIDNPVNRSIAFNQLGQCLEAREDWGGAFDAFAESNQLLMTHHPGARPDPHGPHGLQTLARIREWLAESPMADWARPASEDPGGIAFLVGFPRSGTTLLDRMLSAHPEIEVLEEKSLFSALHRDWSAPGALETLADVTDAQIADAREIYRFEMSRHRRLTERSLVIDKLPLNLAYLFLIHRLFPDAPVVFLQRNPPDACISCYFQSFELEASMGYFLDLQDTARYYDAVMQVAVPSMEQVGNPLHQLQYENLVSDPKGQLERLLSFLALDWNDSVLEYRQEGATRSSDTPSYQRVSEPLDTRSIGKWRHYSEQLEPVFPLLQPWIKHFGYRV